MLVVVKWSKTIQNRQEIRIISLPILGLSILSPAKALHLLLQSTAGDSNAPFYQICRSHGLIPLTDSVAGRYLRTLSKAVNLSRHLTFHDFRRSGATWEVTPMSTLGLIVAFDFVTLKFCIIFLPMD